MKPTLIRARTGAPLAASTLALALALALAGGCSDSDDSGADAGASRDAALADSSGGSGDSGNAGDGAGGDASPSDAVAVLDGDLGALPACPTFAAAKRVGGVAAPEINEASGLAASRKNGGVLWVHNDSGDTPRLFAMTTTGKHLGVYTVTGAKAFDWEDIAIGPGPDAGKDYLYVGDIGGNAGRRSLVIYRVPEPSVSASQSPATFTLGGAVAFDVTYPAGGAYDAETLLVDPRRGDVYVVTKSRDGRSRVFVAEAPLSRGGITLVEVARVTFSGPTTSERSTTAGDVAPDGSAVIIRSYNRALLWRRPAGNAPLWRAFRGTPCTVPLASEPQGEALAFAADGRGYYTVTEAAATGEPLYFFARQ